MNGWKDKWRKDKGYWKRSWEKEEGIEGKLGEEGEVRER